MTVKKAIEICDYLIAVHLKNSAGIRELIKDWTSDTKGLGTEIAQVHECVAAALELLKAQLVPKCKHPKKMRDGKKGERYCMKCNMDLD